MFQQSEAVERAMYGCKWFDASPRFKKYTQFIIMKTQKSVRLLAGRFFAVSLEGFASVRIDISPIVDKNVKFPECLTLCSLAIQALTDSYISAGPSQHSDSWLQVSRDT